MEPSFQVAICECPDINASLMAVDITGRYAMLSGRKCMGLVDLGGNINPDVFKTPSTTTASSQSTTQNTASDSTGQDTPTRLSPVCKRVVRSSKYDPTASHFNRHIPDLFALSTYQVVEVHSIADLNPNKPKLTLRGHSRAIADIEWASFDPHLIGSSAADCLTNLWDTRDSRRPSTTLTSVSGATQVRFSKSSSNLVATSHEIDVRIWDIRQPNLPLHYIGAHLKKINGMDWSSSLEQLITCGQDNTIKLWDLNSNKVKLSANLPTRSPAWRIRYTPVSTYAVLTSTLPQLRSRTECMALKLWSLKSSRFEDKKLELILGLAGHSDVIIDFDWRNNSQSSPSGSCEIVSWSKDQTLRVWRVDNQLIEMNVDNSDFEPECCDGLNTGGEESLDRINPALHSTWTDGGETPRPLSKLADDSMSKQQPAARKSSLLNDDEDNKDDDGDDSDLDEVAAENLATTNELKQEFNLINKNIPNLEFEELNYLRRVCLVTARSKNIFCRLRIALPPAYPHSDCPTFTIIDSNQYGTESLCKEASEKLLNLLNETAKLQLSRSRNCLEPCLRKFVVALQKITSHNSSRRRAAGLSNTGDYKDDPITLSAQRDHSVPFPPTSGARFSGSLLICFGRPMLPTINNASTGDAADWSVETPRSLAQLSAQLDNMRRQGTYNLSNISISYFYYGAMRRAELQSRASGRNLAGGGGRGSSGLGAGSKYLSSSRGKSGMSSQSMMSKSYKCGPVVVYDATKLLGGVSKLVELAESYVFDKDVIKMCRRNAEIAAAYNRRDLVQIWSLAELCSEGVLRSYIPSNKDDTVASSFINHDSDFGDRPWTMHPFGSKLIQSLIDHYVYNCHDVQTAAMLVWTFSSPKLGRPIPDVIQNKLAGLSGKQSLFNMMTSNYSNQSNALMSSNTSKQQNQVDTISDEWSFVNGLETHLYSNSWSNSTNAGELLAADSSANDENCSLATFKTAATTLVGASNRNAAADCDDRLTNNSTRGLDQDFTDESVARFPRLNILSPERSLQNDLIMHVYAELLYRLNLLNQRAMVLKNIGSNSAYFDIFGDKQTLNDIPDRRLPALTIQCNNVDCRTRCCTVQCQACKKYSFYCSICRLPVKGSCSICMKCLHGGHVSHFDVWFNNNDFCPTGCGCKCLVSDD